MRDPVRFPPTMSEGARDLVERLLDRNPLTRIGAGDDDYREIAEHAFFNGLNWEDVLEKRITPEWMPQIRSDLDVSNFDRQFTSETATAPVDEGFVSKSVQMAFNGFTSVCESRL
jgi:serine/threonine protein kinase